MFPPLSFIWYTPGFSGMVFIFSSKLPGITAKPVTFRFVVRKTPLYYLSGVLYIALRFIVKEAPSVPYSNNRHNTPT
jgi:hypothetical protein